jgi:predicted kinase
MNYLIICVGISGSGKSTWAGEFLQNNTQYLRINRDDIRKTLNKDLVKYYDRKDVFIIEKIVSDLEQLMFETIFKYKKSIILDNTNLNIKTIQDWIDVAYDYNYKVVFKLFDCNTDTAKVRVISRDSYEQIEKVNYIDKQSKQYIQVKKWILEHFKDSII